MVTRATDITTDGGCGRATDPAWAPDVIMALASIKGHPDCHGPSGSMVLECQHVLKWQPTPRVSAQPLMVTGTMTDINADPGYGKVVDSDIALGYCLGPDITITPGGSTGHSYQDDPSGIMTQIST